MVDTLRKKRTVALHQGTGSMGRQWHRHRWLIHIAIAAAYALVYVAIRPFSNAHWPLTSGFRMACLLTVPYRYWPALVLGEIGPLTYTDALCAEQFGQAWFFWASVPPLISAMPIVWFSRKYLRVFPAPRTLDMAALLTCALAASLTWALISYALLYVLKPTAFVETHVTPMMIAGYLIGNYAAILTIVPWVIFGKLVGPSVPWREIPQRVARSRLAHATVLLVLPSLVMLTAMSFQASTEIKDIADYLLFLPVVWLTLFYGWRGTVVGAPLSVSALGLLLKDHPDPATIQPEMFVAFALTTLFSMGATISARKKNDDQLRLQSAETQRVAVHCMEVSEQRLRQAALSLEQTVGMMNAHDNRLLARVWTLLPANEGHGFYQQAASTQNHIARLAEKLHPIAWRQRGLPAALSDTIGRALSEVGITYSCQITGRKESQLASSVHAALFRLACEAVASVTSHPKCHDVKLLLRGGVTRRRRWIVMRVAGSNRRSSVQKLARLSSARSGITEKLGAAGLSLESMKKQVSLFGGTLHHKENEHGVTITLLMHDPNHLEHDFSPDEKRNRLWVT